MRLLAFRGAIERRPTRSFPARAWTNRNIFGAAGAVALSQVGAAGGILEGLQINGVTQGARCKKEIGAGVAFPLIKYRAYRSALFGVTPSLVEGWGYGASECLDFGLPVIVSTVPGLLEAVRGLMPAIDPQDQAAWYAKIRLLSENKDEIAELRNRIKSGYRPVSSSESWEAIKAALWQQSSS